MKKCLRLHFLESSVLLYLVHDGLESLWIVHGEVSKDLAVDFDTFLVEKTHQY